MDAISETASSFGYDINVAVVGASGGIGSAIADAIDASPHVSAVFRLARSTAPHSAIGYNVHLDLEDEATIEAAAEAVAQATAALHLIIVATGTLHDGGDFQPEKSWTALSATALDRAFRINATGPALVAKHFLPLLVKNRKAGFAALSARVGSIEDNRLGGWYGYRASKAALNMLIKSLAIELARKRPLAYCVGLHPGTVDTALSKPFQRSVTGNGLFTPAYAAQKLLGVLDRLDTADSGGLFAWDGTRIPA